MRLRKLTGSGLSEFSSYIQNLREGQNLQTPKYLLDSEEHSEAVELDLDVSEEGFSSRYEMGEYLVKLFRGKNVNSYLGDAGFWSWFALLWFDQLCPVKNGQKSPAQDPHYILSHSFGIRQRHAVYTSWQLVNRYGDQCEFMLSKLVERGDIAEQMMGSQYVLSADGVVRLASKLYTAPERSGFKKGAAGSGAGSVRRYVGWLSQIKLTYDYFAMTPDDLQALLPREFSKFLEDA